LPPYHRVENVGYVEQEIEIRYAERKDLLTEKAKHEHRQKIKEHEEQLKVVDVVYYIFCGALQQIIEIQAVQVYREIIDGRIVCHGKPMLMDIQRPICPEPHIIGHVYTWQKNDIQCKKQQYLYACTFEVIIHGFR